LGTVVLVDEELIPASPETVFELFGAEGGGGWFFGARCTSLTRGAPVRFDLPLPSGTGPLEGSGRILEVDIPRRLVIAHETPWQGRVVCTVERAGAFSRVRVVAEIPEGALRWLLRRQGAALVPEVKPWEVGVGLLVSLSGPFGINGAATDNLARLAVSEVNDDGPPAGRPLRLVVADDCTSPAVAAAEARRLVEDERCPVVIASVTSASFEAVRPVVESAGALLVFGLANEGGPAGPLTFRLGEHPEEQIAPAIPYLMAGRGARRWYLAGNDYCWPWAVHGQAQRAIAGAGGLIVGESFSALGARTFDPLIQSIDRSGAEIVLSTFVGSDLIEFTRRFNDSGLGSRCALFSAGMEDFLRDHAGDSAAGAWAMWGYFKDLPTPENRAFLTRYQTRFGELAPAPSGISEAAYEAVHLVSDAARAAGGWEPAAVARELVSASFRGPRGRIRVQGQSRVSQPLYLAEATPGGFTVRDAFAAGPG
jgi:urea transport system substrate-binding protein